MSLVRSTQEGYDLRFSMIANKIAALPEEIAAMIWKQVQEFRAARFIQRITRGAKVRYNAAPRFRTRPDARNQYEVQQKGPMTWIGDVGTLYRRSWDWTWGYSDDRWEAVIRSMRRVYE